MRLLLALLVTAFGTQSFAAVTAFDLPWMNSSPAGQTYDSSKHPQGVFVVEAYFLNCPYCNDNAPHVNDLAESYAGESRVQVLDVGIDRKDEQYAEWIRRHQPNHPVLKDASKKLIKQLGTAGYPSTYVIDCKGNVLFSTSGKWSSNTKRKIKTAVDDALKAECT